MFTRRVIMNIKPGTAAEVGRIFEGEVIPPLRRQRGMRHDDTFISTELSEAVLNSYWDTQECAESYCRATYPAALKALSMVLDGTPQVETFGISSATFHRITAPRREAYRSSKLGRGVWPSDSPPHRGGQKTATVSLGVNERRSGAVTILDLDGELRAGGSRVALQEAVERLSAEGQNQILLNLSGLTGIDAGGLGELLRSGVELHEGGGRLMLLRPARALLAMMSITKLMSVFDIFESESEALAAFAEPALDRAGRMPPASTRAKKRILKIGLYKPGDLASEVTTLDDVSVRDEGDTTEFKGHATVRSRFKGRDFGSLYQLSKKYEKRQGRWQVIASTTARLGDE